MLRLIHLIPAALFAYFAWLQLDDPDPGFWACLYLLAALVPLMHYLDKPRPRLRGYLCGVAAGFCLAGILLGLAGATRYLDHVADESLIQDMQPDKPYIEQTREFLGSLIALAVVGAYSGSFLRQRP